MQICRQKRDVPCEARHPRGRVAVLLSRGQRNISRHPVTWGYSLALLTLVWLILGHARGWARGYGHGDRPLHNRGSPVRGGSLLEHVRHKLSRPTRRPYSPKLVERVSSDAEATNNWRSRLYLGDVESPGEPFALAELGVDSKPMPTGRQDADATRVGKPFSHPCGLWRTPGLQ